MSEPSLTREQRAMMAADLAFRAAAVLLRGDNATGSALLCGARRPIDAALPWFCYRETLADCGVVPADIDAACAAIADGKHPADSLLGWLIKMRSSADERIVTALRNDDEYEGHHAHGCVDTSKRVLDLLGCKGAP